jgi:hypothetical protein
MSTRSLIGVQLPNKTIQWVYCHFDGYPEAREPLLHKYFNTYDKALELVSKGEIRSVGEGIDDCSFFDDYSISGIADNLEEFLKLDYGSDFKYLFAKGEWYWSGWNFKYTPDTMDILPNPYKVITIDD